jgi:DNA-binding LacI/PurR family transcriptional regulator/ABC-type glycerol-3-phosphate transport system substrate-binding protein
MATINDVAKRAQVSRGTVSNVINGVKGVSRKKIDRVMEAIRELHYVRDATARSLKTSKTYNVAVVLPNIVDQNFAQIFTGIERVINESGYTTSLYTTSEIIAKENGILEQVEQQKADGLVIATCQPADSEIFSNLQTSGMRLVFIEREPADMLFSFVGHDNGESVRAVMEEKIRNGAKSIALFTGPDEYSSERESIEAYRETLERNSLLFDPHFLSITNFDKESSFKSAIRIFESASLPDAIIVTSTQILEGLLTAARFSSLYDSWNSSIVILGEESWTANAYRNIERVPRRAIRLGEIAAELLLERIESPAFSEPKRIKLKTRNFEILEPTPVPRPAEPSSSTRRVVRAAMLKGSALEATYLLLGDFSRGSGIDVEIESFEYEALYDALSDSGSRKAFDVLQIDVPWMEEFTESGYIEKLDRWIETEPNSVGHFIPGVLDAWARYSDHYYALPHMFGAQLLFYRKDLFENGTMRRMFQELYETELRPPRTWKEFNAVAKFFTRAFNPASPVPYGTTLGGRNSSGAVCEFLPRKWAYENGREADELSLDNHETIQALNNYMESFLYASPGSEDHWWDEQVREFAGGDAAMMILFVAHATELTNRKISNVVGKIDYEFIPGRAPVLGGWSLGINRESVAKDESFRFIQWLTCEELAIPHTILGGATPSVSLYKSSELLTIYPWLPKALESFPLSRRRSAIRRAGGGIVSERMYEKILGEAVHGCLAGELEPKAALHEAERRLRAIRAAPNDSTAGGIP